jgi:hypothetical protein
MSFYVMLINVGCDFSLLWCVLDRSIYITIKDMQ